LLGSSRKSGVLRLQAPLYAREAQIRFAAGLVTNAGQWPMGADGARLLDDALESGDVRRVETVVLELLTWQEGAFHFIADETPRVPSGAVRLQIDTMLVEAAHRESVWDGVRDRVPDARVVPAFVDIEPKQLPLLRLVPQEWEVLTRVDGRRDLTELATLLDRTVLDVAQIVHALIGAGLLTIIDQSHVPRQLPTPPVQQEAIPEPQDLQQLSADDVWIPSHEDTAGDLEASADDDILFDPVALGVVDRDGFPRRAALYPTRADGTLLSAHATRESALNHRREFPQAEVASAPAEPSFPRYDAAWPAIDADSATLCSDGDNAARRGDLAGALTCWSMALRRDESLADADRIREAIALAARLHALLHPTHRV
jgi:hypothetical protein